MNQEEIKKIAAELNMNEIVNEANRIGATKRPKISFVYSAVYSAVNRVRSKKIHPVLIEAIENLANKKAKTINQLISKKNASEQHIA